MWALRSSLHILKHAHACNFEFESSAGSSNMSAEPNRKAPYSSDMHWLIIWQKFGMDLTHRRIAQNLSISIGTVHNVLKLFEETGKVSPKKSLREMRQERSTIVVNYSFSVCYWRIHPCT